MNLIEEPSMRSWKEGLNFHNEILADKEITSKVPRKQIEYAFDLPRQLKNVDKIFARVFGKPKASAKSRTNAKLKKKAKSR